MREFVSIDFETRSTVDLRRTGVYPYAQDATTDVWCMAYGVPGKVALWLPGDPVPAIIQHVVGHPQYDLRAWNAPFEEVIWREIMVERYGFPEVATTQWVDTAAEAAAMALPRSLGGAADVLRLGVEKDDEGRKLMMQMSKPRAVGAWWVSLPARYGKDRHGPFATKGAADEWRKGEGLAPREIQLYKDDHTLLWWDEPEKVERLGSYCVRDVEVEIAIAAWIPRLNPTEVRVERMTQRMNDRGVFIDLPLVEASSELVDHALREADAELVALTGGAVEKTTQTGAMRDWLQGRGLALDNLRKDTVRDLLADWQGDPDDIHRVLTLRQETGKTSTGKLDAMRRCVAADGRAHGLVGYHLASTGRWAGRLIQPQNFPRPVLDPEPLIPAVLARDLATLEATGFSIPEIIASMLRSMLRAEPGNLLLGGDFGQVEARVLAWLAGQQDLLDLFRSGGKVYEDMAAFIFGLAVEDIAKDSFERQIGKNSILGFGFQMGEDRFADQVWEQTGIKLDRGAKLVFCTTCNYGYRVPVNTPKSHCRCKCKVPAFQEALIREDIALKAKTGYRTKNHMIVHYWRDLNDAAISATLHPGKVFAAGAGVPVYYTLRGEFLWCKLPSGRFLTYAQPRVELKKLPEPYEDTKVDCLTFVGVDSMTKQWRRQHTYGGHLTENVVQAVARDLLAHSMLRLEEEGFHPILTVHDEVVCEERKARADLDRFMSILQELPDWAVGFPMAADGWVGERYQK